MESLKISALRHSRRAGKRVLLCVIGECGLSYSIKASSVWRAGSIETVRCFWKMTMECYNASSLET